jgi:predicted  nucleic acid-binding Zn-ribbon protein
VPSREPTPAEIAEDLRELRSAVDRLAEVVERTYVRFDVYRAEQKSLEARVAKVEERHTWVARTAMAGLLLPIVVAVVLAVILTSGGGG